MNKGERESASGLFFDDSNEDIESESEIDLFGNKKRISKTKEMSRRMTLGLPDNGAGLTKDYYNIEREMSVTSLVELIVKRRAGTEVSELRSSKLSDDLAERIKNTLSWKTMEDELNKEDVMVNFRKKMRQARREAIQSIPKEAEVGRKINEERRIHLRTSLVEPIARRSLTTADSVKGAIQEFRMQGPTTTTETNEEETIKEVHEPSDIFVKTKELLEKLGYLEVDKTKQPSTEKLKKQQKEDILSDESFLDVGKPITKSRYSNKSRPSTSGTSDSRRSSKNQSRRSSKMSSSVGSVDKKSINKVLKSWKQPSLSSSNSSKQSSIHDTTRLNSPRQSAMNKRYSGTPPVKRLSKPNVKKKKTI